jgi:parvulin-like peptidyl-prolyl isomerase
MEGNEALSQSDATLLAIVENQPILWGDLRPQVEAILAKHAAEIGPNAAAAREQLTRTLLAKVIERKVLYRAFLRNVAGKQAADKAREVEQQVTSKARRYFYEQEVPKQLKEQNLSDIVELDRLLRTKQTTLELQERQFIESMAGSLYIREQIPTDLQVPIREMLDYYKEHASDYEQLARARWEQLSVYFLKAGSREAASKKISAMGNEALFGGNLQAVAKRDSDEPLGPTGGLHDWTRLGSLKSKAIETNVFSIPLNKMSEIIEDEDGLHIIRVLERKEAGRESFADVQDKIRKLLVEKKKEELYEKTLAEMRSSIPVWSRYPDDIPNALPLQP